MKYLCTLIGFFLTAQSVQAYDIATVLGDPSRTLPFTQKIIKQRFAMIYPRPDDDPSTWVYSILERKGINSSVSFGVVAEGVAEPNALMVGLEYAAKYAPVVLSTFGPMDDQKCESMSIQPNTAYVIGAGDDAAKLEPSQMPHCMSRNILRVAALNQETEELMPFANWGAPVRLAAPSYQIEAIGVDGKSIKLSSTIAGASLTAARLAVFAREHPDVLGAQLIEAFLQVATVRLNSLESKIEDGRVLLDFKTER